MNLPTTAGTTFKFVVASAEQAAQLIREQLGDRAKVLSVRNVSAEGVLGLFRAPKLEVVVQVTEPETIGDESPASDAAPFAAAARRESISPADRERRSPPAASVSLPELLRRSGFSEATLQRLGGSAAWRSICEMPLHRGLVATGRELQQQAETHPESAPLSRAAFIGSHGAGRTTALCKWLSREVFRCARIGHVITAEFDRPNPIGSLPVYCEALGIPLAHFPAATHPATPGGFVYFDLPGLSLRRPADNDPVAQFMDDERIEQRVLVLNAAYDHSVLRTSYAAGIDLGATHVVFTHLDEVRQWGRLWDYLLEGKLRPLFLSNGPSLAGDIEEDPLDAIARHTLPTITPDDPDEDEPENQTRAVLSAAA